jgi:ribosomal protein S12 methylthiotransferase accessory factor
LRSGAYVSPLDFVLFSEDQYRQPGFPFSRFDPTSVIGWTLSQRLSDGAEVLLPASLVYMAYQVDQPHELFNDVYSTGLAIGPDPESAAATALRETIERDSFALHWATRTPPLCIPTERLIHLITPELARLLTTPGVDVSVGDMTTELGIPSLLVVVRPHHLPGIALGACSHPDPYVALRKAIIEAFHTFNWLVEMRRWPREVDAENLREFADHVRLYLSEGWVHKASFLWKDEELSPLFVIDKGPETLSAREQLRRMRRALMEHGHDAYFVSITPPDLADLGLAVIRAVAPTLQPLWAGSGKAGLDRRRIEPFLRAKGRDISQPINTDPHPFP